MPWPLSGYLSFPVYDLEGAAPVGGPALLTVSIMVVTKTLFLLLNNPNIYLEIVIFLRLLRPGSLLLC